MCELCILASDLRLQSLLRRAQVSVSLWTHSVFEVSRKSVPAKRPRSCLSTMPNAESGRPRWRQRLDHVPRPGQSHWRCEKNARKNGILERRHQPMHSLEYRRLHVPSLPKENLQKLCFNSHWNGHRGNRKSKQRGNYFWLLISIIFFIFVVWEQIRSKRERIQCCSRGFIRAFQQ